MSEREALLRHVIEHADDDAPRLVMADWLDEHGEPDRAAFIRLQIARANGPSSDPLRDIEWVGYPADEAAILRKHAQAWSVGLPADAAQGCRFRRGFAEDVTMPASVFEAEAASLWECSPIRGVSLTESGPDWQVLNRPEIGRLRRLTLTGRSLSAGWMYQLARRLPPWQLQELSLSGFVGGHRLVSTPAVNQIMSGVRVLRLDRLRLDTKAVRTLAATEFVPGLMYLSVCGNHLTEDAFRAILDTPAFANLQRLRLSEREPDLGMWLQFRERFGDRVIFEREAYP